IKDIIADSEKHEDKIIFSIRNLVTKNSIITPESMSLGTKKFLFLVNVFLPSLKKDGIILIDEFDNSIHNELVNFFKMLIQIFSPKRDIQLIYTSHNPVCLTSKVSAKQIYLIDKFEDDISFAKVSSKLNKNNSVLKSLIEEKIGSHPSDNEIINILLDMKDFVGE
ncbi:MAG: ATP-binding protein, partial [Malacoplasma sp.]|nr:ATP-binding protein [Malacoplasma sp.]